MKNLDYALNLWEEKQNIGKFDSETGFCNFESSLDIKNQYKKHPEEMMNSLLIFSNPLIKT